MIAAATLSALAVGGECCIVPPAALAAADTVPAAVAEAPVAPTTATATATATAAAARTPAPPLYDGANVVASQVRPEIQRQLEELEATSGWKVHVWTGYTAPGLTNASLRSPRDLWGPPDPRTLLVVVDPSSPNIIDLRYIGDEVLFKLKRPFLAELPARYGNIFFVRDRGESAAVEGAVGALAGCLAAPEGCRVVPGLPSDQYFFTLAFAVTGGLIAGFVSRIPAQGIVRRQWVWLLIFSPLWASLAINFSIGPVVSRTSDLAPVLANVGAFFASAALPYLDRLLPKQQAGSDES